MPGTPETPFDPLSPAIPPRRRRPIRIAVDAMGGDLGPAATVAGTLEIAVASPETELILVGRRESVLPCLPPDPPPNLHLCDAGGAVPEGVPPARYLFQHPDAAVARAAGLAAAGEADAFCSLGNTGAATICAVRSFGLLPGLARCAVGEFFLGFAPGTLLIDLGPTVDAQPRHLLAFAELGLAWVAAVRGGEGHRVALLSNGAEGGKGNGILKEAHRLLAASRLPYIGPIEGHDLARGAAEVVVCDGLLGNVLVKFCEGLGERLESWMCQELAGRLPEAEAADLAARLRERFNPIERRGAILLGVRGLAALGHGRGDARHVAAVIRHAVDAVRGRVPERLAARWCAAVGGGHGRDPAPRQVAPPGP